MHLQSHSRRNMQQHPQIMGRTGLDNNIPIKGYVYPYYYGHLTIGSPMKGASIPLMRAHMDADPSPTFLMPVGKISDVSR